MENNRRFGAKILENGAGAARARDLEERSDDVGISRPAGPGIWRRQIRKGRKAEGG